MDDDDFKEPCEDCGHVECICVHEDQGSLFEAPDAPKEGPPWA